MDKASALAAAGPAADYPQKDRDAGLSDQVQGSRRVTAYDPLVGLMICERIAEGETLKAITAEPGYPARQTFYKWVVNQPDLARAYSAAKELSASSFEEEALDLGRAIALKPDSSQKVRAYEVLMNQLRWSAGKRNPRVFSDRGSMQITVPIQINTSLDLGDGSGANPPALSEADKSIYQIEATVVVPEAELVEPELDRDRMRRGGEPVWKPHTKREGSDLPERPRARALPLPAQESSREPAVRPLTPKQKAAAAHAKRLERIALKKAEKELG